jgi:hypothetical protein
VKIMTWHFVKTIGARINSLSAILEFLKAILTAAAGLALLVGSGFLLIDHLLYGKVACTDKDLLQHELESCVFDGKELYKEDFFSTRMEGKNCNVED